MKAVDEILIIIGKDIELVWNVEKKTQLDEPFKDIAINYKIPFEMTL